MEEIVSEIEQKCSEFTRESEEVMTQEQEQRDGDGDDENVIETNVEHDEEDKEESVEFKRLDDGSLRIQMSCSCAKRFEILHNQIGCFYSARKFLNKFLRFGKKIKKSFAVAVQIYQEIAREEELRKAQQLERYRQHYAKLVKEQVVDVEEQRRENEAAMLAALC
ncbi:hypothetical protein CTI12_AA469020 [Artemisia annua]|uniref:Uncharacterized protein n=1 Tax=Artemisia annua TaxID=35608 RepID=A0A2U1LMM2_ARTAN|nr:hypothetical protein CTI12_AA469020 [Artemisia annua]